MNADKWIDILKNFGFPVLVTSYLLFRFDNLMAQLVSNQSMIAELIKLHMGLVK